MLPWGRTVEKLVIKFRAFSSFHLTTYKYMAPVQLDNHWRTQLILLYLLYKGWFCPKVIPQITSGMMDLLSLWQLFNYIIKPGSEFQPLIHDAFISVSYNVWKAVLERQDTVLHKCREWHIYGINNLWCSRSLSIMFFMIKI